MNYEDEIANIDPEITGKFIKSIRKYHNLTQDELAENLFITRKAVSKWETGVGFPSIDVAKRFCDIYGVSFEELIAGKYIFKKREFIFNSTLISSTIVFFLLFITIYSAYLNSYLVYKLSFEDNIINIVNTKFWVSEKHKYFDLGTININNKKIKDKNMYLEVYIKEKSKTKLFSCAYKFGKCKDKFVNTDVNRKFLNQHLNNFYIKLKYNDKNSKSVVLNKKIYVQKIRKIKKNVSRNNPPVFILNEFGNQNYKNDILLNIYNNRASDSSNIKEIDLSFLYNMTKDELYRRYNNYKFMQDGDLYLIRVNKYKNLIIINSKKLKISFHINENMIIYKKNNNKLVNYTVLNYKIIPEIKNSAYIKLFNLIRKIIEF